MSTVNYDFVEWEVHCLMSVKIVFLFGELRTQLTISVHCLTYHCSCCCCLWKTCIGKSWSSGHCSHFERGPEVSYKGVCVTAKFSTMMQNSVNKTTSAALSTVRSHFTLCRYCKPLFKIFVEHGITLIQQINIPKRMFFGRRHIVHLVQQLSVHEGIHFF